MSSISLRCRAHGRILPSMTGALALLALWNRRRRTRQQLLWLDERQLADVGIDPCVRDREIAKWFWQP
jgi:uncharacterized protein YjiS (DUF1127 family)